MVLHPTETMDDVTIVSSATSVANVNTTSVTRTLEIKTSTIFHWIQAGVITIIVFAFVFVLHIPILINTVITLTTLGVSLWLLEGKTKDRAMEQQLKRVKNKRKSKKITGGIYYPASASSEDILTAPLIIIQ